MLKSELITFQSKAEFPSDENFAYAWDQFAISVGAPVYMSFDWLRLWWQFYGKGNQLRLFLFSIGDSLVGALPFYITNIGVWPFTARVARLVGANVPPKIFNPPVAPAQSAEVWRLALGRLFREELCDVVSIGPISETYLGFDSLQQICGTSGFPGISGESVGRDVHTVYYLPKSCDDLYSSFDSRERKVRRKKLRDLEAKGPVRTQIIKDPIEVERHFDFFVKQHATQWESEGRPGHFNAWPRALEFNRELVRVQSKLGRTRFMCLLVGEENIATQYGFGFGRNLYAELPSRVVGADWERLSLGCSSQVKLLESAISENFETMESGLGHYEYKILTGGREHRAITMRFRSNRNSSLLRVAGCSAQRDLLVMASQKVWYKRISPHLPKPLRTGQSEVALKFDF